MILQQTSDLEDFLFILKIAKFEELRFSLGCVLRTIFPLQARLQWIFLFVLAILRIVVLITKKYGFHRDFE